jgi:hypothetical protein
MSLWEYKVITSGKGGFATPALLEKFLNDLGRDEWEIVTFQTQPDNFLAFTGLARRSTQRDWTLEDAAAAAAKAEAEKLRAEFEAKFKAASSTVAAAEERAPSFLEEKVAPDDGFRKPIDTSHDDEPETSEEEKDEWDKLTATEEDELPTFFEAIKPHMRRNQRGPGMSVGVDYLAKKWDQSEDDLKGALVECGFVVPEDEDSKVEYLEYDGDLYWLNVNRRGELWINTKEKPRPVFRPIKAQKVEVEEEPKPERRGRKTDAGNRKPSPPESPVETPATEALKAEKESEDPNSQASAGAAVEKPVEAETRDSKTDTPSAPLPEGPALLERIRPHMRRNRRGPGGSGSASFLSRALKCREADLIERFKSLGLVVPASPGDKPVNLEIGKEVWWLNQDSRGGLWINGRDKKPGETASVDTVPEPEGRDATTLTAAEPADSGVGSEPQPPRPVEPAPLADVAAPVAPVSTEEAPAIQSVDLVPPSGARPDASQPASAGGNPLETVRGFLKETRTGSFSGKIEHVAEALRRSSGETVASLTGAGLKVPEKPREKPALVEHAGEVFWLSRNARGELWVNAKAAKLADLPDEVSDEAGAAAMAADGNEADGDKKARRPRARKKVE